MEDVLSTTEALAIWPRAYIRNQVHTGKWQRPWRGVVVTHNGCISPEQMERVALAAARRGSALAGLTAACRQGLKGFTPEIIDIVLPPGAKRLGIEGVREHYSTMLERGPDVHPIENPRRTTLERSVVDAASWSEHPRYVRWLVIAAFQQRLTNVRRMREALARRGPCRHRALISQSILDAIGGIQSLPERDFAAICSALGLPPPTRQRKVKGKDGHYYLDVYWEQWDLAVEIHGIQHASIKNWDADLFRANEIVIAGPTLLIFSSFAIRHEKFAVATQLARMAMARGWDGELPKAEDFPAPDHFAGLPHALRDAS